ncbi:MAG TPA: HPF/RaiA family ribosome-associated protein [Thermoanaerobaculia bacterium]|nr:HPF/RaiA family ribosome-associated protein [Thermoanaerobaculia bacterium]
MKLPLTITAQEITLPDSIEAVIREKALKLERFYDGLIGCHVRVAGPGRHHRNGGLFDVRIDLSVPGSELVVNHQAHEDLSVAIREAFAAARRRLDEHARLQREEKRVPEI